MSLDEDAEPQFPFWYHSFISSVEQRCTSDAIALLQSQSDVNGFGCSIGVRSSAHVSENNEKK